MAVLSAPFPAASTPMWRSLVSGYNHFVATIVRIASLAMTAERLTAPLGLRRTQHAGDATERFIDDRPEQQHDRQRRDRTDQAIGPEHLHVAAGADHRQAE